MNFPVRASESLPSANWIELEEIAVLTDPPLAVIVIWSFPVPEFMLPPKRPSALLLERLRPYW